jgi:hypothetical protein
MNALGGELVGPISVIYVCDLSIKSHLRCFKRAYPCFTQDHGEFCEQSKQVLATIYTEGGEMGQIQVIYIERCNSKQKQE